MPDLLKRALSRPFLWWALAAVWLVRDVYGNLLAPDRPDARALLAAGSAWLHDPAAIYAGAAHALAETGFVPVFGFIKPPAAAMLAAPFVLLPPSWQAPVWTTSDALAAVIALLLIQRYIARGPLETAVFWAVALYSPPLYAEVDAGQVGGWLLLFACAGLVAFRTRPALSGVLVAAAASLKLYPALMVIGARRNLRPFLLGALVAGVVITVVACIPMGFAGAWNYVTAVLIPSLRAPNSDCAQTSVSTLWGRSVGGQLYPIVNPSGAIDMIQSPLHLTAAASILTVITLIAVIVGAVVAARASGWNPGYGMALGLALGGIIPGEMNPYQYLPLLPLVLMVLVITIRNRRWWYVVAIAAGLLAWWRQPCYLPFPNLWTIGALILFTTCVVAARQFRTEPLSASPPPVAPAPATTPSSRNR
ncbi:MAG TPA: glycosyltransferase 87 family protein [Candidatus Dormibacteraeota bacterium]|nr:glycosyltransferase 87 family protein [Candidatus Dormibacteraeota bacterium]